MGTIAHIKVRRRGKLKRIRLIETDYLTDGKYRNQRVVKIRISGEDEFRSPNKSDFKRFSRQSCLQNALREINFDD